MSRMNEVNKEASANINYEFFVTDARNGIRHVGYEDMKEYENEPGFKGERRTIEKIDGKWKPTNSEVMFDNM